MLEYATIPALLMVINEAIKKAGVPSRFIPLVNLVGGLIGGLIVEVTTTGKISITGAITGILAGASGGGVYDVKKFLRGY